MRRGISLLAVVLTSISMALPAAAEPPERFGFDGQTASAFWFEETEDGGTFTDVFLEVGSFEFDGDTFEFASLNLFMSEFGPDGFTDVFGFADLSPDEYELDTQGGTYSARVEAEILLEGQQCTFNGSPFGDCEPIGPFFVTVVIEWDDATGRVYPSSFSGRSLTPTGFSWFQSRSLSRFTTATGEIVGDFNMLLGESQEAAIGRDTQSDRFRFSIS